MATWMVKTRENIMFCSRINPQISMVEAQLLMGKSITLLGSSAIFDGQIPLVNGLNYSFLMVSKQACI